MKAIDLFSDCGGLTLGLKQAGYSVLAGIEIDDRARHVYALNHPEVFLGCNDIRKVCPERLMAELKLQKGELDLLAGCPPCQGFSRIRRKNRRGSKRDNRNSLIKEFERFVEIFWPKAVMMENVPALAEYHLYLRLHRYLRSAGYEIVSEVLDVADFGVPQHRKRLIMIASRIGTPALARQQKRRVSVRQAIGRLPKAGTSGDPIHDLPERRSNRIQRLIKMVPRDGGSRSSLPNSMQLPCHRRINGFGDVFGRMGWGGPSPTITSGCTNPSKGRFLHPTEDRSITLREAAILQGFPRSYRFEASFGKEDLALMIGNSLPPPFIKKHVEALKSIYGQSSN